MEVIITNKTKEEIYLKIDKADEKTLILPEKQHKFERKDQQKVVLVIIYKSDEKVENKYEVKIPINLTIESDGVYEIIEDKKSKLEKMKIEEQPKKLQTIHKQKKFHHNFDQLKKDQFVFLGNDKTKIYKFKEIKYSTENKIEALLINNQTSEEIIVDCLKEKISSLVKLKLNIIHCEDVMFEKNIFINVNEKIKSIYKIIEERAEILNIGKDFRIVYKNHDITGKVVNKKVFKQVIEDEMGNINEEHNTESPNLVPNSNTQLEGETNNENSDLEKSFKLQDENFELEEVIIAEDAGMSTDSKSKSKNCKEKGIELEAQNEGNIKDNIESLKEESLQSQVEKREEVLSIIKKSKNDKEIFDLPIGKLAEKCLIDLDFSFQNDYLCIIAPETLLKIFSLKESEDSICNNWGGNQETPNIFVFSKNIILKNFYVSWYNNGNTTRMPVEYDFTVYEFDINPSEKEKLNTNLNENEGEMFKYENLNSVWEKKTTSSYKVIFEKKNIKVENSEENSEFRETINNGFFIPTNEIKISKNKIYTFYFKLGECRYEYTFLRSSEEKIFKNKNNDDLIIYGASKNGNYYLLGFNYKININA